MICLEADLAGFSRRHRAISKNGTRNYFPGAELHFFFFFFFFSFQGSGLRSSTGGEPTTHYEGTVGVNLGRRGSQSRPTLFRRGQTRVLGSGSKVRPRQRGQAFWDPSQHTAPAMLRREIPHQSRLMTSGGKSSSPRRNRSLMVITSRGVSRHHPFPPAPTRQMFPCPTSVDSLRNKTVAKKTRTKRLFGGLQSRLPGLGEYSGKRVPNTPLCLVLLFVPVLPPAGKKITWGPTRKAALAEPLSGFEGPPSRENQLAFTRFAGGQVRG